MAGLLDFLLNDPTASGGGWLMQLLDPQGAAKAGTRTPLTSGPPGTAMGLGAPATNPPGMAQPPAGGLGGAMGLPSSGLLGDSPLGKLLRGAAYGLAAGQGQRGFGAGFGAGLSGAAQMADQRQQSQMRNMLFQRQNQAWQQQQQQAQAQSQALEAAIAGLPPDQQALARADPSSFFAAKNKAVFDPAKPDKGPTSVQEYQYAVDHGSFTGSYNDWLTLDANRHRPITTVNNPKPPPTLTERVWDTLLHGDPNSPEYGLAWQEATQPRPFQNADGTVTFITPTLPPNIRRPAYLNANQQGDGAPAPGQAAPPPGAGGPNVPVSQNGSNVGTGAPPGVSVSQPVQTGASPKGQTEDARKNQQLYQVSMQQMPQIMDNFDELGNARNQAVLHAPLVSDTTAYSALSDKAQVAYNALLTNAASYLYSVSGATANPGEVKNLAITMMPMPFEGAEARKYKKLRIQQMADSIKLRAGLGLAPGQPLPAGVVDPFQGGGASGSAPQVSAAPGAAAPATAGAPKVMNFDDNGNWIK